MKSVFQSGLIVALPADLPLELITKLSDALLASPILAIQIPWADGADVLIGDLQKRGGVHWLVGVSGVETAVHAQNAVAAGADFIISPTFEPEIEAALVETAVFYLPTVHTIQEATLADKAHVAGIVLSDTTNPPLLEAILRHCPQLPVLVAGRFSPEDVPQYAAKGVAALIVHDTIFYGSNQLMATVITNARAMQRAWDRGKVTR